MLELLATTYFGSTVEQYIYFFASILGGVILAKVVYFFIKKYGTMIASKTENKFDDLIIEAIETPALFAGFIGGIVVGYGFLSVNVPFIQASFPDAVSSLIMINLAWLALKLVDGVIDNFLIPLTAKTKSALDDQLIPIIRKASKISIVSITLVIILSTFGIDILPLLAGLGIGGLAIAFAAQKTVADLFGGISIFASKPFVVGDAVILQNYEGIVDSVGIRYTRVKNWDGRIITIPNSQVAENPILNITSEKARRVSVNLGLTYATSYAKMQKAMDLLKKIVKAHPDTDHEDIKAVFKDYGASSLNIWFVYYIPNKDRMFDVMGEVNMEIKKQFEKEKIDFAFPSQSVYIESMPKKLK